MRATSSTTIAMFALVALGGSQARAEKLKWNLTVEGGSEFDSNLHRVEVVEGMPSEVDAGVLVRSGARYQLDWRPKKKQRLSLDLRGTSKLFTSAAGQSENIGILFMDGRYDSYVGESRALLGLRVVYYDAINVRPFGEGTDPVDGRSFRTTEAMASLGLPSETEHRFTVQAGFRDFVYKPDSDFDWQGEQLGLRYTTMFWRGDPDRDADAASVDVRASYLLGNRRYQGPAFRNACPGAQMADPSCFVPTENSRHDLHHSLGLAGTYTGRNIYSLAYGAQIVDTNSYGQASVRQRIEASLTSEIPGSIFLTGSAIVRINTFVDPLLLARDVQSQTFVSIEDENRNSLSLHLARDLTDHWAVESRFAIYSNEFSTQEFRFRRQTAYLGLLYRSDKR